MNLAIRVAITITLSGLCWFAIAYCLALWQHACIGRGWVARGILLLAYAMLAAIAILFALTAIVGIWS